MLGEDDELAAVPVGVEHLGVVLEQPGELVPFAIGAGLADLEGQLLQLGAGSRSRPAARRSSGPRWPGRAPSPRPPRPRRRGRPRGRRCRPRSARAGRRSTSSRTSAPRFRSCSSRSRFSSRSRRRLSDWIDGFRRRGEPALQDRQGEARRSLAGLRFSSASARLNSSRTYSVTCR